MNRFDVTYSCLALQFRKFLPGRIRCQGTKDELHDIPSYFTFPDLALQFGLFVFHPHPIQVDPHCLNSLAILSIGLRCEYAFVIRSF